MAYVTGAVVGDNPVMDEHNQQDPQVRGEPMGSSRQGRQVAVVPFTEGTLRLAERLAPRCALAGLEIAWVGSRGEVRDVRPVPAAG